jgi:hypothetical protein
MATQADVRRIALALPGVNEASDRFAFNVERDGKPKGFVWAWNERVEPKKPRVARPDVLAVRVRDQGEKAALLAADQEVFFTEPHYDGFPAVLVRLRAVTQPLLRKLIVDAWRCQAPRQAGAATPSAARGSGRSPTLATPGRSPRRARPPRAPSR